MINGKTKLLCLLGSPIEHSFSPTMHNAAFDKLDINASYMAFDISTETLQQTIVGLCALDFVGANVTIPHKVDIIDFLDVIDEKAERIGAVNTIVYKDSKLFGYNTDVLGFIESFKIRNIDLEDMTVAVLGTGGASKAIVIGLIEQKVSKVDVFSRVKVKAIDFVTDIEDECLCGKSYKEFENNYPYDLVINTTPVGMHPNEGEIIFDIMNVGHSETIFYDLIYNPLETEFLKQAKDSNRIGINGLDMLIYQGVYALKLWYPTIDIDASWKREDVLDVLKTHNII